MGSAWAGFSPDPDEMRRTAFPQSIPQRPPPPTLGERELLFRRRAGRLNWEMGRIKARKSDPRVTGAAGRLGLPPLDSQDMFAASSSPHGSKWIALPISSPAPVMQWNIPLPLRSGPALQGTRAWLPGKAPDVTAKRDP